MAAKGYSPQPLTLSVNDYMRALGAVSAVMMRSPEYCQYPIACLAEWIRPALLLDQYHLFHDEGGNLVGYMTWAFLAEDVEQRLLHDPAVLFHLSEWNEGDRLWIMDFVVLNHDLRPCLDVARARFAGLGEVRWLRRREDGSIRKVLHCRASA
ncbi:toxin-activating lysine-acyltransferase [Rhodanobacter umsongensis]|uniref:RTX toxin-activating lysine-acyltransferase n=1 Tax=Rhodanobacter umsongensis TaxID=633153 RepID=A0ABW0JMY4_9GAMM